MTLTLKYRFINMDQTETADTLKNLAYTFYEFAISPKEGSSQKGV